MQWGSLFLNWVSFLLQSNDEVVEIFFGEQYEVQDFHALIKRRFILQVCKPGKSCEIEKLSFANWYVVAKSTESYCIHIFCDSVITAFQGASVSYTLQLFKLFTSDTKSICLFKENVYTWKNHCFLHFLILFLTNSSHNWIGLCEFYTIIWFK